MLNSQAVIDVLDALGVNHDDADYARITDGVLSVCDNVGEIATLDMTAEGQPNWVLVVNPNPPLKLREVFVNMTEQEAANLSDCLNQL